MYPRWLERRENRGSTVWLVDTVNNSLMFQLKLLLCGRNEIQYWGEPWNNGKEVPRWGVADIQKMSLSTTHNLPALLYTKRRCVTNYWRPTSRQYVTTLHYTRQRTPDANKPNAITLISFTATWLKTQSREKLYKHSALCILISLHFHNTLERTGIELK